MSYELDSIDCKILHLLKRNANLSIKEIANEIGLSSTPIYERIKRLEKNKVVLSYTIKIDKEKIGKKLTVLCNVSLNSHAFEFLETFEKKIIELKEITDCFHIAGNFDFLLRIEVKNMDEYAAFVKDKLSKIPHIGTVQSSFIMKTLKEE